MGIVDSEVSVGGLKDSEQSGDVVLPVRRPTDKPSGGQTHPPDRLIRLRWVTAPDEAQKRLLRRLGQGMAEPACSRSDAAVRSSVTRTFTKPPRKAARTARTFSAPPATPITRAILLMFSRSVPTIRSLMG